MAKGSNFEVFLVFLAVLSIPLSFMIYSVYKDIQVEKRRDKKIEAEYSECIESGQPTYICYTYESYRKDDKQSISAGKIAGDLDDPCIEENISPYVCALIANLERKLDADE